MLKEKTDIKGILRLFIPDLINACKMNEKINTYSKWEVVADNEDNIAFRNIDNLSEISYVISNKCINSMLTIYPFVKYRQSIFEEFQQQGTTPIVIDLKRDEIFNPLPYEALYETMKLLDSTKMTNLKENICVATGESSLLIKSSEFHSELLAHSIALCNIIGLNKINDFTVFTFIDRMYGVICGLDFYDDADMIVNYLYDNDFYENCYDLSKYIDKIQTNK